MTMAARSAWSLRGWLARLVCCVAIAAASVAECHAESGTSRGYGPPSTGSTPRTVVTRAYIMNGLLSEIFTRAVYKVAAKLRARDAIVEVGSWTLASDYTADVCAHRDDRIIVIGYSLGAVEAAKVATEAQACGARDLTMVGIDPPPLRASVPPGSRAVNFVGVLGGTIAGAKNIPVTGYDHIAIVDDPVMQERIISTALALAR